MLIGKNVKVRIRKTFSDRDDSHFYYTRSIIARFAALLLCLAVFFSFYGRNAISEEKPEFTVSSDRKTISHEENRFYICAPEKGTIRITVRDENTVYREITAQVDSGKQQIIWDGCGYNKERLISKYYQADCELTGDTGNRYKYSYSFFSDVSAQAVLFALPSGEIMYLNQLEDWFLETKMILDGNLRIDFYRPDEVTPCYRYMRSLTGGRINKIGGDVIFGRNKPEAGSYRVAVYEETRFEDVHSFSLAVEAEKPAEAEIPVTGNIMPPEDADDSVLWEYMMRPSVVVDIRPEQHQVIREEPDKGSASLGTVHGQTQCLSVFEIRDEWAHVGAWNHEAGDYVHGWVPVSALKVELPRQDYGLLLNKKKQTLTVFYRGERIATLLVSTGLATEKEPYQETSAGCFLTGMHRSDFSTNGMRYDHVIQYDGGNLMHQIPYYWGDGKRDFSAGQGYLGAKASHACIRIQAEPAQNGINAYWIWTHIPYHTRLIILDDPEEREAEKRRLTGQTDFIEMNFSKSSEPESKETLPPESVVITFGGDCVLGGRESYYKREDTLIHRLDTEEGFNPFSGLAGIFEKDDMTVINLECVLQDDANNEDTSKAWRFRGLTDYAGILPGGSVEMVNIANNHTIDYGETGYQSTLRALDGYALTVGNGLIQVVEMKGHLFGFGGCRETTYLRDPSVIEKDIGKMKDLGAEVIIYQCHWGKEYDVHRSALQTAMARACVRAGANLVIGHHPHVVQGMDLIEGVPVVYSLGNLVFGGTISLTTFDALVVQAAFQFTEDKLQESIRLIPVTTSSSAAENRNDYCPVPASAENRNRILNQIQQDTAFSIQERMEYMMKSAPAD